MTPHETAYLSGRGGERSDLGGPMLRHDSVTTKPKRVWIEVEGDKPKVERTRRYFSALRAGLKTAEEVSYALQRENERLRAALSSIAETARWYADNDQRLPLEVDHALCVEVLSEAENALDEAGGKSA